jgi:hypothetical protein
MVSTSKVATKRSIDKEEDDKDLNDHGTNNNKKIHLNDSEKMEFIAENINYKGKNSNNPAILIINVEKHFIENPAKLKPELDKNLPHVKILQIKATLNNNLIITFEDELNLIAFMDNKSFFKDNHKIILDKTKKDKKSSFEIIIKGLTYSMAQEFGNDLNMVGINRTCKFSNKEDYKIVKAECINEETMYKLISHGLHLNYCRFKVEKYLKPIKPTQCFNCQKFGHFSTACDQKTSTCVKCGGIHKLSECKETNIKCANCNESHTSNYGGCKIYQIHVKGKTELMKKKNDQLIINKQYSQVVSSSSTIEQDTYTKITNQLQQSLESMKTSLIQSFGNELNELRKTQEAFINNKFEEFSRVQDIVIKKKLDEFNETVINNRFQKCFSAIDDFKTRLVYVQIDLIKIVNPNVLINENQIQAIMASVKQHTSIKLNFGEIKGYIDKLYA